MENQEAKNGALIGGSELNAGLGTAEELLKRLLNHFYVSSYGGLEWSYIEGTTIREIENDEFELTLMPFLDEEKADALKKVHGVPNRKRIALPNITIA
jgi:hypothetical protein